MMLSIKHTSVSIWCYGTYYERDKRSAQETKDFLVKASDDLNKIYNEIRQLTGLHPYD